MNYRYTAVDIGITQKYRGIKHRCWAKTSGRLYLRDLPRCQDISSIPHSAASKASSLNNVKYSQHHGFINVHQISHIDVLDTAAEWPSPGRRAQCQRLKGLVPGAVAEDVEVHGQALDQEQLLMEAEKGSWSRRCRPARRQPGRRPIISKRLPIRILTTTIHGRTRLPFPRPSTVTQANCRARRATFGAIQPWKMAGPTSNE